MTTKTLTANGKYLGRPSKYDPAYCEKAIELGKLGYSFEMICAELGIPHSTADHWRNAHDDFRTALDEAKRHELAFFEKLALAHMVESPGSTKLNTGLWSRSMSARFPAKYSERSKIEVTGKEGKPIEVDVVHDFAQDLVDDLLSQRQKDAKS
jgi:hypothetical protein